MFGFTQRQAASSAALDLFWPNQAFKTRWAREPKSKTAHSRPLFFACRKKTALVSSCTDPEAMHVPSQRFKTINFPNNRVEALMAICPEKPVPTALLFSSRSLPTKYIPVPWPRVWKLKSWAHGFFGTIVLMKFVLRNPCQQLCSFSLAQCQQNCARPIAQGLETLNNFDKSWGHSFPEQSY